MRNVKRIEIVIDKPHEREVRALLRDLDVRGWTVFEPVAGFEGPYPASHALARSIDCTGMTFSDAGIRPSMASAARR